MLKVVLLYATGLAGSSRLATLSIKPVANASGKKPPDSSIVNVHILIYGQNSKLKPEKHVERVNTTKMTSLTAAVTKRGNGFSIESELKPESMELEVRTCSLPI
ncbi:hypothetical protein NQD34_005591 [Periophthalmus magnuspinnatus]|nr:hypothetical protein NQD34_005591 [Periophthalmus magnuspinnatus]